MSAIKKKQRTAVKYKENTTDNYIQGAIEKSNIAIAMEK